MQANATQEDASVIKGRVSDTMASTPIGKERRRVRVLLADTGDLLRQQLTAMLAGADCDVMVAADGFEVLCRLPELRPDILLIASDLPRLSGIQVCSLLRQSPDFSELPVLILTTANAMVDKVRAELAGANACLEKPFRSRELQTAFNKAFEGKPSRSGQDCAGVVDNVMPVDH